MTRSYKNIILIVLGVLISSVCIIFVYKKLDIEALKASTSSIGLPNFLLLMLLYFSSFIPRALRWQFMLYQVQPFSFFESFRITLCGFAGNNIFPLRLGEFIRAFILAREKDVAGPTALASVAAEKIFDGLVIVIFLGLGLLWLGGRGYDFSDVRIIFIAGTAVFAGAFLMIVLWFRQQELFKKITDRLGITFLSRIIEKISDAFRFIGSLRTSLVILLFTITVWLIEGAAYAVLLRMLGISPVIPAALVCLTVINLGILIPSAPGYIGVFQAASIMAFLALGLQEEAGVNFGIIIHLVQIIPVTLVGGVFLVFSSLNIMAFLKNKI